MFRKKDKEFDNKKEKIIRRLVQMIYCFIIWSQNRENREGIFKEII